MREVKRVVIIGPESTGKSTLCETLASHYKTLWCPEYARTYLLEHGSKYSFDDLLTISRGQLALEKDYLFKAAVGNRLLFIDTDMYVMKVWCEYVFGRCHQFILDQIAVQSCDLYLLCQTDLPWVADELREYPDPDSRNELFHIYKDILVNQAVPWRPIEGTDGQRLQAAIRAVDEVIF